MKKAALSGIFLLCILPFFPAFAQTGQIKETGSKVTFSINHATGKVKGNFTGMEGTVTFDEQNPEAGRMVAKVKASSIDTGNRARDSDLRDKKFFNVDQYPNILFRSKAITKTEKGYQVTGDLTIKDRTKEVVIPFRVEKQGDQNIFTGSLTVNRKEFDLGLKTFPPMGKKADVHIRAVVE